MRALCNALVSGKRMGFRVSINNRFSSFTAPDNSTP